MPFTLQAVGRLAHEPQLSLGTGKPWVRFRLLDSRLERGEEITEAVTFKAFGDLAERFCERSQKGQVIHAWGSQETQTRQGPDGPITETVFILFHFVPGPRPWKARQAGEEAGQREGGDGDRRGASRAPESRQFVADRQDAPFPRVASGELPTRGRQGVSAPVGTPSEHANRLQGGDARDVF